MYFITALSLFLLSWSGLFLIDFVLKGLSRRYVQFVEKHDVQISPLQLRFYTHKYDGRLMPGVGESEDRSLSRRVGLILFSLWFDIGVVVAIACCIFMVIYLSWQLWPAIGAMFSTLVYQKSVETPRPIPGRLFQPTPTLEPQIPVFQGDEDRIDHPSRDEGLTPIIPGINMPWAHIPIFMFVLVIAAVLHELGHAWAARMENIRVSGFGVFVLGIYPGAFTEIDDIGLNQRPTWSRLRVYCAGVWHNLVLAALGFALVYSTPFLLAPLFVTGHGVTVEEVSHDSGLHGGLLPGQIVTKIDNCKVYHPESWITCAKALQNERYGRCMDTDIVKSAKSLKISVFDNELHCCDEQKNATPAHICFESQVVQRRNHQETKAPNLAEALKLGIAEKPRDVVRVETKLSTQLSCLDARTVTDQPLCNDTLPCDSSKQASNQLTCIYPALYNGTKLVRLQVENDEKPVLFVGKLEEFLYLVEVSPLVSRWSWVPRVLPHTVELLGKYVVTLSVALGVLNAVPCFALDGQHIVVAISQSVKIPRKRRHRLVQVLLLYGTFLLAANVVLGFFRFFRSFQII
ncbi:unnamed protein product, partial [Mesorhabditis belari]|uniref:Membrane-bound transcription factor site-2 protease n=1 Tax=Mesorhabditis belari TaxID=2138241 RepID=A0AAF3EBJ2_9BILA